MVRFAANISTLFTEVPFLERFTRAKAAGFERVEFQFPYDAPADDVARAVADAGLGVELFNLPPGNFAAGERGIANDPRRRSEFEEGIDRALEYAAALGVEKINCLVGLRRDDVADDEQWAAVRANLTSAAERLSAAGIRLLVEPLNPFDMPTFLLVSPSAGFDLVAEVGHPNLSVQYDVYHAQRTEGNVSDTICRRIGEIGHIQIADSPGRGEPGTGELNWPYVFEQIDSFGYDGWVGVEYFPSEKDTELSLGWLGDYVEE